MTKIIIGDPHAVGLPRKKGAAKAGPASKRIRDGQGNVVTIFTLDANSASLGDDVLAVFTHNVVKARRAHRDLIKKHGIAAE